MVRVLGNSVERVTLSDLNDVVYYHQVKEYTDQEFDKSRDLKKEISKGRISVLEKEDNLRAGGKTVSGANGKDSDLNEIRALIRDSSKSSLDAREVAREIAPVVADIVRQEMSKIQVVSGGTGQPSAPVGAEFRGPEYIPTISTEGMVSNVTADEREESAEGVNDALAELRKLKGQK